jgi:hypothetical protein
MLPSCCPCELASGAKTDFGAHTGIGARRQVEVSKGLSAFGEEVSEGQSPSDVHSRRITSDATVRHTRTHTAR